MTVLDQPRTVLPAYDDDAPPAHPRPSLGRATPDERFAVLGSWAAALALAFLVTQRLMPLPGLPWFLITWFVLGLVVTAVTAAMSGGRIDVADRVATSAITGGALVVGAALVSTIVFVVSQGWEPLTHLNFFTDDMSGVGPKDAFDRGGVLHAIVGSGIELGLALLVTLPARSSWPARAPPASSSSTVTPGRCSRRPGTRGPATTSTAASAEPRH